MTTSDIPDRELQHAYTMQHFNKVCKGPNCAAGGASIFHSDECVAAHEACCAVPVAWMTEDGRVATEETKQGSMSAPSKAAFNIPLYASLPIAQPVPLASNSVQAKFIPPSPPYECKTEVEKIAYAAGWWKAMETRKAAPSTPAPALPVSPEPALLASPKEVPKARQPLTEAHLCVILLGIDREHTKRLPPGFKKFARAIEAAHGIRPANGGAPD